jgi:pimeloyl-ACP methyl ester carboxylesterase
MAHGAWCWDDIVARLSAAGHEVHALDLPLTSLADDADAVGEVLDSIAGATTLVGHSYGGLVISVAAQQRSDVDHLVYVAAAMLGADELLPIRAADFPDTSLVEAIGFTDDGWIEISDEAKAAEAFYNTCEPAVATASAQRLRPTAAACLMSPTGAEPWKHTPSTYVVCQQDGAIHPDFQRVMANLAGAVEEFDTDHSPFLSTPDRLTELLVATPPPQLR